MKQKELERRLKTISSSIAAAGIIPNAIKIAKTYGAGRTTTYDCHMNSNFRFQGQLRNGMRVDIHYNDGLSFMGGGYLRILTEQGQVFNADRSLSGKPNSPDIPGTGFGIETYKPGEWVRELSAYAKHGPKKEKTARPEDQDVPEETLKDLKSRLPL